MRADREAAVERVRMDIEHARQQFDDRLAYLRAEIEAAKDEFRRALERIAPPYATRKPDAVRDYWPTIKKGRWRPRPPRGLDGGDPVPVEPKPKPKPLLDGAEAPIE